MSLPTSRTSFSVISAKAKAADRCRSTLSLNESVESERSGSPVKKLVSDRSVKCSRCKTVKRGAKTVPHTLTLQVLQQIGNGIALVVQQQGLVLRVARAATCMDCRGTESERDLERETDLRERTAAGDVAHREGLLSKVALKRAFHGPQRASLQSDRLATQSLHSRQDTETPAARDRPRSNVARQPDHLLDPWTTTWSAW